MASKKIQTGLRLNEDVYNKLRALSEAEHRSMNNCIEAIIWRYLADYEAEHGEIPPYQEE